MYVEPTILDKHQFNEIGQLCVFLMRVVDEIALLFLHYLLMYGMLFLSNLPIRLTFCIVNSSPLVYDSWLL